MSRVEIARRAGTSPATVSRVLSNNPRVDPAVRERVLAVVRETGYVPNPAARALATRRNPRPGLLHRTIALAINDAARRKPHSPPFDRGVLDAAEEMDLSVIVAPFSAEERERGLVPPSLTRTPVDGIVARPGAATRYDLLRRVAPVVILGAAPTVFCPFTTVEPDTAAIIPVVADHLADLGHRWIEFVPRDMTLNLYRERAESFLGRANLRGVRATVADTCVDTLAEYVAEYAARPAHDRPTALFASSDFLAMDLIRLLYERGLRVPEDVSVAGCDGQPAAERFVPPITSTGVSWIEIGRAAVRRLVQEIEHPGPRSRILLGGPLVARKSTAPPPFLSPDP